MQEITNDRIEYIDVMRGIAILLVILEHCIGYSSVPLARDILSFHMPLFFFISGLCFSANRPFLKFLTRKAKTILIPQITLGVITIASALLFDVFLKKSILLYDVNFIGAFLGWFLIVLFLMEILLFVIIKNVRIKKILYIFPILIAILFYFVEFDETHYIQQTIAALFFGLMGFLSRPLIDKISKKELLKRGGGFGWLILLIVAVLQTLNAPIFMYINIYGNKLLFLSLALLGITAIIDISLSVHNTTFIKWCGNNSIILYVIQFSVIRTITAILSRIIPQYGNETRDYLICFIIVLATVIPITLILNKYFYWAFGKNKPKSGKSTPL